MTDEGGFALVEMLVAAALFALVMVLAVQGTRLALGGWRAVERHGNAQAEMMAAHHALRRMIAETEPVLVVRPDGGFEIAFDGGSGAVRLMAAVPVGAGRLSAVEIRIDDGLLIAETSLVDPASRRPLKALEAGVPNVLLRGVTGGGFAYWGADQPGAKPRWHETWAGRNGLPQAIRLVLELDRGREWPELVAAPLMEAPVDF